MSAEAQKPALISVFGSAYPQPGSADYEHARSIGASLATAGYAVMSGGYGGVMAAASQGAAEAGGRVIGVTCKQLEELVGRAANPYLSENIAYPTLDERMRHLIYEAEGYVICSGGYGTLHEIASTLEWMRVGQIPRRPLICFSEFWQPFLRRLVASEYIPEPDRHFIQFAHSNEEMLRHLAGK